jgi:hypothetical protein
MESPLGAESLTNMGHTLQPASKSEEMPTFQISKIDHVGDSSVVAEGQIQSTRKQSLRPRKQTGKLVDKNARITKRGNIKSSQRAPKKQFYGLLEAFKEAPADIWFSIFNQCTAKTLRAISQSSRTMRELSETHRLSRTWFTANWDNNVLRYRDTNFWFRSGAGQEPICLHVAHQARNVLLVLNSGDFDYDRIPLESLLGVFPNARVIAMQNSWDKNLQAWINSEYRFPSMPEAQVAEVAGHWKRVKDFQFVWIGKSLEKLRSSKCLRTLGPPTTNWLARIWNMNNALCMLEEDLHDRMKPRSRAERYQRDKAVIQHIQNMEGGRYKHSGKGSYGAKLAKMILIGKIEARRLGKMEEKFRNDIGTKGSEKRARFERELEQELVNWPTLFNFTWDSPPRFDYSRHFFHYSRDSGDSPPPPAILISKAPTEGPSKEEREERAKQLAKEMMKCTKFTKVLLR